MIRQCAMRLKSLLFLAAMLGAPALPAYDKAALMPDDPFVLVRISSVSGLSNSVQSLPIGRLWNDEGFQNFLGHPDLRALFQSIAETNEASRENAHIEGELWRLLKGEVIVAVDRAPDDPASGTARKGGGTNDGLNVEMTYALVAQCSTEDYGKMMALEQRLADMNKERVRRTHVDFQGQDVILEVRLDQEGNETKSWQACVGEILLESDRREWVEGAIARIRRDGQPAPGRPEEPGIEVSFSGAKIKERLEEAISKFKMPGPGAGRPGAGEQEGDAAGPADVKPEIDAAAVVKALGLDTLKSIRMTVKLEPAQVRVTVAADRGPARNGIWKLIDARPAPGDVKLPFVPADAVSFGVERANYPAMWNEIPAVLRSIGPQWEMQFGMIQSLTGIDVAADVMAHLDTLFVSLYDSSDRMLAAVQLKNASAMSASLKRLLGARDPAAQAQRPELGAKEEEFRGTPLYVWQNKTGTSMGVAVAGSMLYAGDSELIRGVIRAQTAEKPAEDAFFNKPVYRKMLKDKPDGAMGYKLIDLQAIVRSMLSAENVEKMKDALAARLSEPDADKAPSVLTKALRGIDFSKMPPADRIAAFFGPVFGYSASVGDRLEYQWLIQSP